MKFKISREDILVPTYYLCLGRYLEKYVNIKHFKDSIFEDRKRP